MPFQITENITLQDAVSRTATLCSLPVPADVTASQDVLVQQLIQAVNEAGRELLGMYPWQQLAKPASLIVRASDVDPETGYAEYELPEDFHMFVDETQWNKTSRLPALGPVNPQHWKRLEVRVAEHIMHLVWRVRRNMLQVRNPGDNQEFVAEYISNGWVVDADNPNLFKNVASKSGDQLFLDDFLLVRLARAKWREYKGFDVSGAMRDFLNAAEHRFGREKGAPTLNLCRGRWGYKYLDYWNIPDHGYGVG